MLHTPVRSPAVNELPPPALPAGPGAQAQGRSLFGGLWGARGDEAGPAGGVPTPLGRPETIHPDVEYVLSGEEAAKYCTAADGRPRALVVALETTRSARESGALRVACAACKEALAEAASSLRVAVVTFDETARVPPNPQPFPYRTAAGLLTT
eukprot:scaffold29564_cov92-Isochrysis_galbana.AAC.2